ncbi:hypothetical protein M5K25_006127 [Dendrobium thyrsiflorum]|uniref:Uncharacterized protein n=1 Tax=Dendrobium thyrsiflorum TaxID=117978 RepID=A0ABD0VI18_DENTH
MKLYNIVEYFGKVQDDCGKIRACDDDLAESFLVDGDFYEKRGEISKGRPTACQNLGCASLIFCAARCLFSFPLPDFCPVALGGCSGSVGVCCEFRGRGLHLLCWPVSLGSCSAPVLWPFGSSLAVVPWLLFL